MKPTTFTVATHLCIVWGIALATITLVEWYSLDRDPVRQEILSPFIERTLAVSVEGNADRPKGIAGASDRENSADAVLRYDIEISFNGPLFLACFFTPMLIFQAVGLLLNRIRRG